MPGYLGVSPSIGRLVGLHGETNRFEHFLAPVFDNPSTTEAATGGAKEEGGSAAEYILMLASIGAAGAGLYMGWKAYGNTGKEVREPIAIAAPPIYNTLLNKYYVDEIYDVAFTGRAKLGRVRLGDARRR